MNFVTELQLAAEAARRAGLSGDVVVRYDELPRLASEVEYAEYLREAMAFILQNPCNRLHVVAVARAALAKNPNPSGVDDKREGEYAVPRFLTRGDGARIHAYDCKQREGNHCDCGLDTAYRTANGSIETRTSQASADPAAGATPAPTRTNAELTEQIVALLGDVANALQNCAVNPDFLPKANEHLRELGDRARPLYVALKAEVQRPACDCEPGTCWNRDKNPMLGRHEGRCREATKQAPEEKHSGEFVCNPCGVVKGGRTFYWSGPGSPRCPDCQRWEHVSPKEERT